MSYTLNQWDKPVACLECADLTPDNNISENAIRPFVVGRKNRLFYKSPAGAETACILYSIIETSKLNGLNPSTYLKTLFECIPYVVSPDDWIALLPWYPTVYQPCQDISAIQGKENLLQEELSGSFSGNPCTAPNRFIPGRSLHPADFHYPPQVAE